MCKTTEQFDFAAPHQFGSRDRWILLIYLVLAFITVKSCWVAEAQTAVSLTFGWNASPSPNVVGYKIYCGTNSGNYTRVVSVGLVTEAVIGDILPETAYFFCATAVDVFGLESDPTGEVNVTVPERRPTLGMVQCGVGSVISWPTNFTGYTLQSSGSPAGGWTNVAELVADAGGCFSYTNQSHAPALYFRLQR
jgi:hypothetical protein